jgi:hypothetical protein
VKRALLLMLALGACAKAGAGQPAGDDQPPPDSPNPPIDAPDDPDAPIDAPPIDAGPTTVTLTQTTTDNVDGTLSLACRSTGDGSTRENSWYRVFRLADAGITNGFHVTAVTFGVAAASGLVPVQVKIGTYSGTVNPSPTELDTALITPLAASTAYQVPNTNGTPTLATVPVSANVPALSQMIVEIAAPDELGTAHYFHLGANADGQSSAGYLRAPICNAPQPTVPGTFDPTFTNAHFVIKVTGTY